MKAFALLLATLLFITRLQAAEVESLLEKSPDGVFELVAIKDTKLDDTHYVLRNAKTKAKVIADDNEFGEDYINPGFGSPTLEWNPKNSRLLIIDAKLYRDRGNTSTVFRITDDSKLVLVPTPEDAIPDRWNPDGSIVLLVRHEDVYRFDAGKNVLTPVKSQKAGK
ncbi:hypothetical protein [Prosthecobacter sp.]|uniref:hypothetical protein n=1 Tax=Prosthecobacter sp. TaxID=1965333 RepID=UPI0037845048